MGYEFGTSGLLNLTRFIEGVTSAPWGQMYDWPGKVVVAWGFALDLAERWLNMYQPLFGEEFKDAELFPVGPINSDLATILPISAGWKNVVVMAKLDDDVAPALAIYWGSLIEDYCRKWWELECSPRYRNKASRARIRRQKLLANDLRRLSEHYLKDLLCGPRFYTVTNGHSEDPRLRFWLAIAVLPLPDRLQLMAIFAPYSSCLEDRLLDLQTRLIKLDIEQHDLVLQMAQVIHEWLLEAKE